VNRDFCHIPCSAVVKEDVKADSEPFTEFPTETAAFDFETTFRAEYSHIARVIARVVQDPARAEELAAEAFWKLSRTPSAQGANSSGWLYRVASRMALDELRKQLRRKKYEGLFSPGRATRTPEEHHQQAEEQDRVRLVLARLKKTQGQLLILRSHGLTYDEIAQALDINPTSIGTLLRRAEEAFRKEYLRRYGQYQ
jgi:RNA polymerase sigma factor (sigma-70 family)